MAKTYAQLTQQIEALSREAEKLRREEIDGVIVRIKEAIRVYGLSAADLGFGKAAAPIGKAAKKAGRAAQPAESTEPKFRGEPGQVWGGRGPRPKWLREAILAGKKLEDFAV